MEDGYATGAAELSAVAATVAGHVPELSSEIWALLAELALRACQYLGQAVLRPVDAGSGRAGEALGGVPVNTDSVCALITVTTERRTDVR
jgi:hypothetical protein